MTDVKALVAWLDQQNSVATNRKIGTQVFCMAPHRFPHRRRA